LSDARPVSPANNAGPLLREIVGGVRAWRLWTMLGWNDIRLRYRRSVIGPLWLTIAMGVLVVVLGVIYSKIFNIEIHRYLPYVALGFIVWGFIASTTNEACSAFVEGQGIIRQIRVPYLVFVLRVVWRNIIVLAHTLILIVPIAIIFKIEPRWNMLLAIPALVILFLNQLWLSLVLGVVSTRFRDVPQLVATVLQIAIFATPIMWPVSALGEHEYIAQVNPLYHLIDIVRAPLMGESPQPLSWGVSIAMLIFGAALASVVVQKTVRRLVYWL
jgi:ABC-type polysaccharide/polyol phosphate export permease